MADPAACIVDVAAISRDHVHVEMIDRLAGRGTRVGTDVVPGRRVLAVESSPHDVDGLEDGDLFVNGGRPLTEYDATRGDQRVPFGHREGGTDRGRQLVLRQPPLRIDLPEH